MKVRAAVESLPMTAQFIVEMAPQTAATYFGSAFGGLLGAMGAGGSAEALSQEIGLSPRSDLGLGLAAGGPAAGRVVGGVQKGVKRVGAAALKSVVPLRVAIAKNAIRKSVDEFEGLGAKILSKLKGPMTLPPSKLFSIAERAKILIPKFRTTSTNRAFKAIRAEVTKHKRLLKTREGRVVISLLDDLEVQLTKGGSITFGDLVFARQTVGKAISAAERAAGVKLGAEKILFKGIADDMDHLASLGGRTGAKGKIAKAAFDKSKLIFAIADFDKGVAKFVEPLPGIFARKLKITEFRRWLDNATNPKHPTYKKKMTEALEKELPDMKRRLVELTEFADTSPAGPGSLVVRTITAGVGAAAGGAVLGGPGMVLGGLLGVRFPEMLTAILSSDAAVKYLKIALTAGTGTISRKAWDTAGQIAAQGIKFADARDQRAGRLSLTQAIGP